MSANYEKAKKAISGLVNAMVATSTVFDDTPQNGSSQSSKTTTATQTNTSTVAPQKSAYSADDYIQGRMDALKAKSNRIGATGVSKWLDDAYRAMEEMENYNKANASKYDANYGGEAGDRIKSLLNSSKDVYDYIYNHKDEFKDFDALKELFSQYRSNLISYDKGNYDTRQYYSQFGSEEGYNNHMDSLKYGSMPVEDLEKEHQRYKDAYESDLAYDIKEAETQLADLKANATSPTDYASQEAYFNDLKAKFKQEYGIEWNITEQYNPTLYYDEHGAVTLQNLITVKKADNKIAEIKSDAGLNSSYEELMAYNEDIKQMESAMAAISAKIEGATSSDEQKAALAYIVDKYGIDDSDIHTAEYVHQQIYEKYMQLIDGSYEGQQQHKDILAQNGYDWDEFEYYFDWKADRDRQLELQKSYELVADQYPVLAKTLALTGAPIGMINEYLSDAAHTVFTTGSDEYSAKRLANIYDNNANTFVNATNTVISQKVEKAVLDAGGSQSMADLAVMAESGVSSALQSAMINAACVAMFGRTAGSIVSLGIMAHQAASSQFVEAIKNGSPAGNALVSSVAAGAAEAIFEKISLDSLLNADFVLDYTSLRGYIKSLLLTSKNVVVQGLVESSEEIFTTIANKFTDDIINGDHSAYYTAIDRYMKAGLSEGDARKQAGEDYAQEIISSAIGGFFGGIAASGVQTTTQNTFGAYATVKNVISQNKLNKAIANAYDGDASALINEILAIDPNNEYALKMKDRVDGGKKVSNAQIKELVSQSEAAIRNSDKAIIRDAVSKRLKEIGETERIDEISEAIAKLSAGEDPSAAEAVALRDSKYAAQVESELKSGAEWTRNLGTESISVEEYSRLVADAQSNPENIDSTPTINATENANNEAEKASFPVNVLADNSHEGVMAAMAAQQQTEDQPGKSTLTVENVAEKSAAPKAYKSIYNLHPTQEIAKFDDGFRKAYEWGLTGAVPVEYAKKSALTSALTAKQVELAYAVGVDAKNALAAERDARMQSGAAFRKPSAASIKNGRKVGTVKLGKGVSIKDLNQQQKKGVDVLRFFAEATGKDITLVKSTIGSDGKYRLSDQEDYQGKFSWHEDMIYIDINAGLRLGVDQKNDALYTLLRTFGHEFVHTIERDNATGYNELREVVFAELRARGVDVERLVKDMRGDADGNLVMGYDDATREVVAEALSDILRDSKFIDKLVNKHQNLAEYLLDELKKFIKNIREYFENIKKTANYEGARALQDNIEGALRYAENIIEVFDRVALQSVENYQAAVTGMSVDGGVRIDGVSTEMAASGIDIDGDASRHQHSIRSVTEGAGLVFTANEDGTWEVTNTNGDKVTHVTAKHMENSPLGNLVKIAAARGFIPKNAVAVQCGFLADVVNMCLEYRDSALVWEVAGTTVFSALKSNSDTQYGTTIDFSTVCKKTQAIIDAMSETMLRLGRGLTRSEVEQVYLQVGLAGEETPCPVCYVFSRWMGVGGILDQMNRFQEAYADKSTEDIIAFMEEIEQRIVDRAYTPNKNGNLKKDFFTAAGGVKNGTVLSDLKAKASSKATSALKKLAKNSDIKLQIQELENLIGSMTPAEAKRAEKKIATLRKKLADVDTVERIMKEANDEVEEYEAYQWLAATMLEEIVETDENGKNPKHVGWKRNESFKPVPADVLFDLNKGDEFASNYPASWKFRTTKGCAAGKAILPYSDARVGETIQGVARGVKEIKTDKELNAFLNGDIETQKKLVDSAIAKMARQNIIGGQRYQSTSDFRYEYGSDYLITFLEMQAVGAKVQLYTKVIEAVDFLATVGCDCNLSVMPLGDGFITLPNGEKKLIYSSVTGINAEAAIEKSHQYNNVQLILVGISDEHVRLALEGTDVTFVIPFHGSGNTVHQIQTLMNMLGEHLDVTKAQDYTAVQSDHHMKNKTAEQKALWDLRCKIISGSYKVNDKFVKWDGNLSADEYSLLESPNGSFVKDLYRRFYVDKSAEEYGVDLQKDQSEQIFPYEYWDKTLSYEEADQNGERFKQYCASMGIIPRFSGKDSDGKDVGFGDFTKNKGYWKLLIDRPMYNNKYDADGNWIGYGEYHEQARINVTNFKTETIDPKWGTAHYGDVMSKTNDPSKTSQIADAVIAQIEGKKALDNGDADIIQLQARNNTKDIGEDSNGSTDTELLEGRKVSASDRGGNSLRKQGTNTQALLEYLGYLQEDKTRPAANIRAGENGWLSRSAEGAEGEGRERRSQSFLRGLSRTALKDTDSVGRHLGDSVKKRLEVTVLKDRDGTVLSLFHWTSAVFDEFKIGDIGFHVGTLASAYQKRKTTVGEDTSAPTGTYKEMYVVAKNPLWLDDLGTWTPADILEQLRTHGLIPFDVYQKLHRQADANQGGYNLPTTQIIREIIEAHGYDSIFYRNNHEDVGSVSVIALHADQIITVAENGILKEGSGVTEQTENIEQYQSRDYLSADQQKHFDYNQKQTTVGSTLRTLKGSAIKRSAKHGVGKEIGGEIYFHKAYAEDVVPDEVLSQAEHLLEENYPGFEYNCLKYNPNTGVVAFQEAPDFDTAREPIVGDYVSVNTDTGVVKKGHSNYIWHHKWNWVRNDYSGFDVAESWIWSKRWLSTLTEVSDGNGIERWNAQLDRFGLPKDGEAEDRVVQYQLREVPPVRPTSSDWRPAHNESWFAENGFPLYRNVSEEQRTANEQHEMDKRAGGHGTQNKSTLPTYRKIFDYIKARGDNPRILDASSGLGAGTELGKSYDLNIHDIEPFPNAGYAPEWTDYEGLQDLVKSGAEKPFDVIISNAVLNVLAQDSRDNLIAAMDSLLRPGGQMFINVIGKDYSGAVNASPEIQRNAKGVPVGTVLTQEGENGAGREVFVWQSNSVQKVFSPQELKSYLSDALGDGYIIETPAKAWKGSGLSGTMVVVTKPSGTEQYQERTRTISDRALLQMAAGEIDIEGLTDAEKGALEIFKSRLDKLQALQQKRAEAGKLFHEQTFGENKNKTEANKTRNRMKVLDAQIEKANNEVLDVEEKSVLRDVLKKARGIVEAQEKEAAEAKIKRMRDRHDHATERRDMKARIRRTVMALDKVLNRGNKKQNVKEGMKDLVTDALKLVDILFTDDYNDTDMIRNGVGTELTEKEAKQMAEAKVILAEMEAVQAKLNVTSDPVAMLPMQEKLEDLKKKMDYRRSQLRDVFARERSRLNSIPADSIIGKLADEYKKLQDSEHGYIAGSYQESVYEFLTNLKKNLEHKVVRDMSTPELGAMYSAFTMVLTTVKDANKAFNEGIKETIEQLGNQTMFEVSKEGKNRKVSTAAGRAISSFSWNNTKPIYAFERIGSNTLTMLFNNIANGENVYAVDVEEAKDFKNAVAKKYGYTSWDFKKTYEFTSSSGMKFNLNLQQIMSIYAYSKREAAHDHLTKGGIVFSDSTQVYVNKKGIPLTYLNEDATAYNLSDALVTEIVEKYMTKEQRDFVDEMQDYLSTVVGENGNEISMKLYGVKLFGEKHYFPLRSSGAYLTKAKEAELKKEQGQISIVNSGFTKATTPNASNPIVLEDFMSVWADHVNDMSLYHAFVLPLEDFRRVYNYNSPNVEEGKSMSVDSAIRNAQGRAASQYIDQLLRDINGGTVADPRETPFKSWVSKFKKTSVVASMSVVVQQPTAMYRAMAYVDRKYFGVSPMVTGVGRALGNVVTKAHTKAWEEVKTYAPGVAIIKEIGGFDTSTGQGIVDYISTTEYEKGKLKALVNDKQYRRAKVDEVLGKLPAMADELAWVEIWNAVKRETKARNKNMDVTSEEFLKLAGERFTEVIRKTQVYDSVFTKSSYMRSKNGIMAMLTSFMAEPTTTLNMVQDAGRKLLKGNVKHAARVAASVTASIIINNILRSIVYAMRDDDEDETFLEKYTEALVGGLIDDMTPFNYFPFLRDIWSLAQGYDVERADLTVISVAIEAANKAKEVWSKDTSNMDEAELAEHEKACADAGWAIVDAFASLFGWPVKNIRRDIVAVFNTYDTISKDAAGRDTTTLSWWDKVKESAMNSLPELFRPESPSKREKLYRAILAGDDAYVERLKSGYSSEDAYHSALRQALRENDPRIREAAAARFAGDFTTYTRIAKQIIAERNFEQNDIMSAINSELNKLKPSSEDDSPKKLTGLYKAEDFAMAVSTGDWTNANAIKTDIINTHISNGKTEDEANNSFISSSKSAIKDMYLTGDISESEAIKAMTSYMGMSEAAAKSDVQYWAFKDKYPDTNVNSQWFDTYYEKIESSGLDIKTYVDYRNRVADITGEGKKERRMAVINSLPITNAQKDALYYAEGWTQSKIYEAPWH